MTSSVPSFSPKRRAAVVVLVAVSMMTLLMFGALAVDVGYICALTTEVQNTADAAALAGVSALRDGERTMVKDQILDIIARNQVPQGFSAPGDETIELGQWDCMSGGFVAVSLAEADQANAVRVLSRRNNAPLFFAALMGKTSVDVSREAIAMFRKPCSGIWGLDAATVPGNVRIDSYDSTTGLYNVATANSNGDVCSNGDITVSGSIEIYGDVMPGPDSSLVINGGAAVVTGVTCPGTGTGALKPIDFSDVAVNNDNGLIGLTDDGDDPFVSGNDIHIGSHDNLTLPPGTYYFGDMTFGSFGSLTLTGPTTIYMTGDFDATAQGVVNTSTNPADLTILSSGTSVSMTGHASFYGSIYAPDAEIRLSGGGEYFGALVGGILKVSGNFQVHVDESLALTQFAPSSPPFLVR